MSSRSTSRVSSCGTSHPSFYGSHCTISISHIPVATRSIDGIQRPTGSARYLERNRERTGIAGKTNLFILPDFGRDSDNDAGGNGFQHHRTGDALSRTTWMMAMGPGIRQNAIVDRPWNRSTLYPPWVHCSAFPTFRPRQAPPEVL